MAYIALLGPIGFAIPFLLGLVAGHRRLLERLAQHRRLLRTTAIVGIGVSVLGAAARLAGAVRRARPAG